MVQGDMASGDLPGAMSSKRRYQISAWPRVFVKMSVLVLFSINGSKPLGQCI